MINREVTPPLYYLKVFRLPIPTAVFRILKAHHNLFKHKSFLVGVIILLLKQNPILKGDLMWMKLEIRTI